MQLPLQPLADHLEGATYATFERDAAKYEAYTAALQHALHDVATARRARGSMTAAVEGSEHLVESCRTPAQQVEHAEKEIDAENGAAATAEEALLVTVLGAGRGPLVAATLQAADALGEPVQVPLPPSAGLCVC